MGGRAAVHLCWRFAWRRRHLTCGVYLTQEANVCGEPGGAGCAGLCAVIQEKSRGPWLCALDIMDSGEPRLMGLLQPVWGRYVDSLLK